MSNAGQAVLSIGGAIVGFFATGGNPAGAAWGYRLDAIEGAATFPAREAAQEAAGDAHPPAGAEASLVAQRAAGAAR